MKQKERFRENFQNPPALAVGELQLDAWEALTVFVNRNNIAQSDIQYISEIINGSVRLLWWSEE